MRPGKRFLRFNESIDNRIASQAMTARTRLRPVSLLGVVPVEVAGAAELVIEYYPRPGDRRLDIITFLCGQRRPHELICTAKTWPATHTCMRL